jgi:hypothetical protein
MTSPVPDLPSDRSPAGDANLIEPLPTPSAVTESDRSQPSGSHWMQWLGLLYGLLFGLILWLAYTRNLPSFLGAIPNYDIPGHIILYAIASYLGHRGSRWKTVRAFGRSIPLFPMGFTVWTVLEECLQALSPNRTFSASDLIASLLGIVIGWWLANRDRRPTPPSDRLS